jgi:hypothetical protein
LNHVGRHDHWGWLLLGVLAVIGPGCSDDDDERDGNHAGSASSSGVVGGAGGSGGVSGPDEVPACRSSEPADVSATFTRLAGEQAFVTETACDVDGVAFAANERHRAVVVADARRIDVIPAGSATGLSYTWDGARDLACKGEFSEYLEIDGHGRYVRVGFLNGKPSVVLFGLCLGDASP